MTPLLVVLVLAGMGIALATADRRTRGEATAFYASAVVVGFAAVALARALGGAS